MNNTSNPLVSVVMITYNSARYVLETLESVKNQTWQNLELIISDDCSTDDTLKICTDWLSENKDRFAATKLITVAQNTGIPANCNRGLRAMQGDWMKSISGDDILLENCIADNIEFARNFPEASFIASDVREIDDQGLLIREKVINEGIIFLTDFSSVKKQLKAYARWPAFLNVPSFFCSREVIVNMGYCDEDFKIFEDTTMVIRIMEKGYRLFYMKKPTVAYRIHQNSVSRSMKIDDRREKEALKVFLKYRKKYLNILNPLDLSIYYEVWLRFIYKGINGRKGDTLLRKLSLYFWYMRLNGVKSY